MHYCKWCKKQMSGSHRQHRDNPDFKSKMQIANMPNPNQSYKERCLKHFDEKFKDSFTYGAMCSWEDGLVVKDFISKALEGQMNEVIETLWQVREDWRNDEQIQAVSAVDYLISLIKKA